MQSERVTFLTTPEGKAAIAARAARRGVSTGEFIRLAVENLPDDTAGEEELAALVNELVKSVPNIRASLERSTQKIESSITDVDQMLRQAGIRK